MPKKRGPVFTVATPDELAVERHGEHWWTDVDGRRLRLSNLDKVFWPEEGYTKGDLLAYYFNVAPVALPFLADRPLTLKRMPDGVTGQHFYEKNAAAHTPAWVPRCPVVSEEEGRVNSFLMAQDTASLLYVVNLGAIELHPLHSRCGSYETPDYLFFDLDPFKPATFDDVLAVAMHVRAALGALGIEAYPKTSGATGMQIFVGVEPTVTFDQTREFVATVGRAILRTDPDRVTMEWDIAKRTGKVFIDHNMNRKGANIAGVYSVRPEPGAPVSTPLSWDEVEAGVHPRDFTIANVHPRFRRDAGRFLPVLEERIDIRPALDKLGIRADDIPPARVVRSARAPRSDPTPRGGEPLAEYERRRDFEATPEPPPSSGSEGGDRFVIQKHNATRLHYDLRLERDGVMVSWAVPRGLPTRTGDRRLAVQTEHHPIEYSGFEGWIPEGNYGAGEVRIFDAGRYEPLEWEPGKITFRLHGRRHIGEYHLIRTGRSDKDWIVLLSKRSAAEQPPEPPRFTPMLAEGGHEPFDDPSFRFEPKLDGVRTLAYVATGGTTLYSRTGRDQTAQYPELANLAQYVNALSAVLDGEIVALDGRRVSFQRLQQRMNLSDRSEIERIRRTVPVSLYVFDLLWLDGEDLTGEPLERRRERLEEIVTEDGPLKLTLYRDGEGRALFDAARSTGLEGVIAKRLGSAYQPGRRTGDWRKIKALNRQDCVILGWTPGAGSRTESLGALLVGAHMDGGLRWIGQVGTGFTQRSLADVLGRLREIEADQPPVDDPALAKVKGARWVRPELVCEVEYLEMTQAGKLRAPSFKGLRTDKPPEDCVLEPPAEA